MGKYQYILFDMDGTLVNTEPGIIGCLQLALNELAIGIDNTVNLRCLIGPPLKNSFMKYYKMNTEQADEAVTIFRRFYAKDGLYNAALYPDIHLMLEKLKRDNIHLFVATSKPTDYAKKIAEYLDIEQYFDAIIGSNPDNTRSNKSQIINYIIEKYSITEKSKVLMVGDKEHDIIGAAACGIDAVGITYGYGDIKELIKENPIAIFDSPLELIDWII